MASQNTPLLKQLIVRFIGLFLLLEVLISTFMGMNMYRVFTKDAQERGIAIAMSVTDTLDALITHNRLVEIGSSFEKLLTLEDVSYIVLCDSQHQVMLQKGKLTGPNWHNELTTIAQNPGAPTKGTLITTLKDPKAGKLWDIALPTEGQRILHVGLNESQILKRLTHIFLKSQAVLLSLLIISLLGIITFTRKLARPLTELERYSSTLIAHEFKSPPSLKQEVEKLIAQTSTAETHQLGTTLLQMEEKIEAYTKTLQDTLIAKERIENELAIAKNIQMEMLPTVGAIPHHSYDCFAYMSPAKEVGGDFYDVVVNPNNQELIIALGDVSGKGLPAALTMAITVNLIRCVATQTPHPSEILQKVNQQLSLNNDSSVFVTLFLGSLNLSTGTLRYCLAGHPAPYHLSGSELQRLPLTNGMALGVDPGFYFQEHQLTLQPNDQILSFSDGISEAQNASGSLYTEDRLTALISDHLTTTPQPLCERVLENVNDFVKTAPQADDITLLALQWHGEESQENPPIGQTLKVHFTNTITELEKLQQVTTLFATSNTLPPKVANNINLVLEELLTNTIFYGYQDHNEHLIYVTFSHKDEHVHVEIEDDGIPFNPLEKEDIATDGLLEEREIGGLGIHLVKNLTQNIHYERKGALNILTFDVQVRV